MTAIQKIQLAAIWLWAGIAIGGNMIAAPAKFQVSSLTTAELLLVGRAQFGWLGVVEIAFATGIAAMVIFRWHAASPALIAAIALLALQQGVLTPILQSRSDMMQTDVVPPESHVHLIFIAAELVKLTMLFWAGWRVMPPAGAQLLANNPTP